MSNDKMTLDGFEDYLRNFAAGVRGITDCRDVAQGILHALLLFQDCRCRIEAGMQKPLRFRFSHTGPPANRSPKLYQLLDKGEDVIRDPYYTVFRAERFAKSLGLTAEFVGDE